MRGWRSSGTLRARSRVRTTSVRFARWGSGARRCPASRRFRASSFVRALRGSDSRHRGPCRGRGDRVGARGRRAGGHVHRGRRPILQPAGAAEVPQVGSGGVIADLAARDADGARLSGGRLHADERRPPAARVPACGGSARTVLSAVRRPPRSHRDPQGSGRPDGRTDSSRRSATRARSAASRTSSSTAASSRTGRSRTRSRRRTASRRSRSAAPRSTSSSRFRRTASTSTSIRRRRRCDSWSSRSSTRSCGAVSAMRWGRGARRSSS